MIYILPFDLYEDWKELMLATEVSKNIVEELKEQRKENDNGNYKTTSNRYS